VRLAVSSPLQYPILSIIVIFQSESSLSELSGSSETTGSALSLFFVFSALDRDDKDQTFESSSDSLRALLLLFCLLVSRVLRSCLRTSLSSLSFRVCSKPALFCLAFLLWYAGGQFDDSDEPPGPIIMGRSLLSRLLSSDVD
jgi:hypothetical protein